MDGAPHLLFYKRLNPASLFPPAYEICVYPLADSIARQHRLRWQVGSAGALLLLGGFLASQFVAARFFQHLDDGIAFNTFQQREIRIHRLFIARFGGGEGKIRRIHFAAFGASPTNAAIVGEVIALYCSSSAACPAPANPAAPAAPIAGAAASTVPTFLGAVASSLLI